MIHPFDHLFILLFSRQLICFIVYAFPHTGFPFKQSISIPALRFAVDFCRPSNNDALVCSLQLMFLHLVFLRSPCSCSPLCTHY